MTVPNNIAKRKPILGCIADDVTGATDLAINLVQGGMRVLQLLGVPNNNLACQSADFDAIVVALKSRSIPSRDAISQSLDSIKALQSVNVQRFYFKYCSTFDSTEQGNIGPVAESLMEYLEVPQTIFCPAFPRAGRSVYHGHLFVGDSLLHESGMENHPLNPMTDSNLVRFLAKQSSLAVGLLTVDSQHLLESGLNNGLPPLLVADAYDDASLESLATESANLKFVTGGSGLARYLPAAYRRIGLLQSGDYCPQMPNVGGRSLIVAGSCSLATNAQVDWMRSKCPAWPVDVTAVMQDADSELVRFKEFASTTSSSQPLLLYSTANPADVKRGQDAFGKQQVAKQIEDFLAKAAKLLVDDFEVTRLVLAGGETSGAITRALDIRSLEIGPEICAGVPWTLSRDTERTLALALKSGNFGENDFFDTALEMLS